MHDPLRCWPVDSDTLRRNAAEVLAMEQSRKEARGLVTRFPLANAHSFRLRQAHTDSWGGKENQSLNPGPAFIPESSLFPDKIRQLASLGIRQHQGAVDREGVTIFLPIPTVAVAGDDSATALDLDQEDAGARHNKCINLVDRAVVSNKLEVAIEEGWVGVRKPLAQKLQRHPLVGEPRFGKALPSCSRESHVESS